MSQRTRIQTLALATFRAGPFYLVTYDDNNVPVLVADDERVAVEPVSVHCNEIEERYVIDKSVGTDLVQKSNQWAFHILFEFAPGIDALLDDFKQAWLSNPPSLTRTDNFPNVTLLLDRLTVSHPTEYEGDKGTTGRLVFQAVEGRI